MRIREDICRFVYERAKINNQKDAKGMTCVYPEDFDPYPGCFLKSDLEKKVEKSCELLSEEYLVQGDMQGSKDALHNIDIVKLDAVPKHDPFESLCLLQKHWEKLMKYTNKGRILSLIHI